MMHLPSFGLVSILGALLLAACSTPTQRLVATEAMVADRLEPGLQGEQPLKARLKAGTSLVPALKGAVEANEAFLAARAFERGAVAGVAEAASNARPQLSASALGGAVNEGSPVNATTTGASADVKLTQLIYDGGLTRATIDGAAAAALSAKAQAIEAGNEAALEALRAWVDLWAAQEREALLASRSAEVRRMVEQMNALADNGMINASALDSGRIALIDIEMLQTSIQSSRIDAEARFVRYFGSAPASLDRPAALFSPAEINKMAQDWHLAPALRRIAAELVAAEAAESAARAEFKPVVTFNTGVNTPMDKDDTTDSTVGVQLRLTLGDGGRRKARLEAAVARREGLTQQLQAAKREGQSLLAASLAQLAATESTAGLAMEKQESAARQADSGEAQITLGQSSLRQVIDAKVSEYRAAEQLIMTEATRITLQAEIAARTGALLTKIGVK